MLIEKTVLSVEKMKNSTQKCIFIPLWKQLHTV